MAETTQVELVTPSRVMISRAVEMVVIPAKEGLMGVLPRHAPVLAGLSRGIVEIHEGGKVVDRVMIDGGLADVGGETVTILAERAVNLSQVTSQELSERAQSATQAEAEFLNEAAPALYALSTDSKKFKTPISAKWGFLFCLRIFLRY